MGKSKEFLRNQILIKRKNFSKSNKYIPISKKISKNIISYLEDEKLHTRYVNSIDDKIIIGIYHPIFGEVFLEKQFFSKFHLALPRIIEKNDNNSEIEFASISNTQDTQISKLGITEPSIQELSIIPDIILTPAVAVDEFCNRIGYGKGYFDKYFKKVRKNNKNLLTIAVAFDFQLVYKINSEPHDEKVDLIITESKIIKK